MVEGRLAVKYHSVIEKNNPDYLPEPLKYASVSITEVLNNYLRLDASAFIDTKTARDKVFNSRFGAVNLWSDNGFIKECFYGKRVKRNYVDSNTHGAIGFISSAEMLHTQPKPTKFVSLNDINMESFRVRKGTILISRSGTIGRLTFVNTTLSKLLVSEHAIRVVTNKYGGYIYAYLQTKIGQILLKSNIFGAVINQIEPEHLKNIIVPNAPDSLKKEIHELIVESYNLRDQSNDLIDKAEKLLYQELQLKSIRDLKISYFDDSVNLRNYIVKLSDINLRLDASYHLPLFDSIQQHIKKYSSQVKYLSHADITDSIVLPGRFKRTYVDCEKHGIKFIGGKHINELDPISEKYLSKSIHNTRLAKELILKENCILITRSGTIGRVAIVPKHWDNGVGSEHIIRIFPQNKQIAGYIFCWLNSEYGMQMIRKHTYGAVIDEIDVSHIRDIPLPILKNQDRQKEINDLVLEANELRYYAYLKEQQAIKIIETDIL